MVKNCGCGKDPCITYGAEEMASENGLSLITIPKKRRPLKRASLLKPFLS